MKRTGVVQGLKSLADKIHPNGNAPLTTSESKRLLTALTSSFRRHLDAAHPSNIEDDRQKRAQRHSAPQVNVSNIHSSAAFAQKHMASVLTNPLLMKGGKSYGSAKSELVKDPHRDPIELLEEYDREGAATVRIAELCLDKARSQYDSIPAGAKSNFLAHLQPGRRTLLWLLQSGIYLSNTFADNVHFIVQLAFFLVHEGRQDQIWQWLKMKYEAPAGPEAASINTTGSMRKLMTYHYRWRGRLLSATIEHTVGVTRETIPDKTQSLHADNLHRGLDLLFDAFKLQQSAITEVPCKDWHHLAWMPLGRAILYLVKILTRRLRPGNNVGDVTLVDGDRIDPSRFDRLIEIAPSIFSIGPRRALNETETAKALASIDSAQLHMAHPTTPTATPMLRVLQVLMPDERSDSSPQFLASLAKDPHGRRAWGYSLVRCASLLAEDGRHEKAAWVRARVPLYTPEFADKLEQEERRLTIARTRHNIEVEPVDSGHVTRLPSPDFA